MALVPLSGFTGALSDDLTSIVFVASPFNKVSDGLFLFSNYFKFLLNKFSTGEIYFLSFGEDYNFSTGDIDSAIII